MRFVAITLAVGLAGSALAANMREPVTVSGEGLPAAVLSDDDMTGGDVTGGIETVRDRAQPDAMRLIDLKTGATCKVVRSDPESEIFSVVPFGPGCALNPRLSRIAYWRSTAEGALIMADRGGGTVIEFQPGDGVLYESVYPKNELITIVPAKG